MAKVISFSAIIALLFLFCPQTAQAEQMIKLDLGKVAAGKIAERTLVIQRGIHNIVIPCECIQVKALSKPDQSPTSLEIRFDSHGYKGPVSQDIILVDSEGDTITLRLTADVK